MKRFLLKMAWFIPLAVFFFGVNVWVDPSGLFLREQEQQIAQWMAEGYNVTGAVNIDYRRVLRNYVGDITKSPDVLILGSSRSMVLDSSFFPGQTLYNASTPAAQLPDLVVSYELFRERGLIPKRVVLGLDAHLFNGYLPRGMHLREEFARAVKRMDAPYEDNTPFLARFIDQRYAQLISPAYFQSALDVLPAALAMGRPQPRPTKDTEAEDKLVRADGSLVYERLRRELLEQEAIDYKASRYAEKHPEGLINYRSTDPKLKILFEKFVASMQGDGAEIVFLLTPFHPATYGVLMANDAYRIIADVETYYREYAKAHQVPIYGSFDPAVCGFINTDFYDAVHSKPEAIRRLLPAAS
jgi:hypothetical protein